MRPRPIILEGYDYRSLLPLVEASLDAGVSALMTGHPGIGKSALAKDLAARRGLELIDLRLAQREPAELGGVYFPDRETGALSLLAPEWVRAAVARPCLVFLDEINAAVTRLHQAAAYQIVLERRVGPFVFHPETRVLAAGNLEEDEAIVTALSSALTNRFVHFKMRPSSSAWLAWAEAHGVHPYVIAYVSRFGDDVLFRYDGDPVFPSPRSWVMASALIARGEPADRRRLLAAAVGHREAESFEAFLSTQSQVDPARIIERGELLDFRKHRDTSFVHAAIYGVAAWLVERPALDARYLPNVVRFASDGGLDPEYAFMFLRHLAARSSIVERLKGVPAFHALAARLVDVHKGMYA